MKDKYLVGILTFAFFLIYFIPNTILKFISVAFILFFAPGFFTLRIYKKINKEELLLISPPLSLGISGAIALLLAAFSILNYKTMLIFIGTYIAISFLLSSSEDIGKIKLEKPHKIAVIVISLSLILLSILIYADLTAPGYKEIDIAIESWPHNATLGENLSFDIYVKNWDYDNAHLSLQFEMNNRTVEWKNFTLEKGESKHFIFERNASQEGINLASFNLYLNGNFYTNVHIYFNVKAK